MGEISPAAINVAILAGGLFLYALIWYLTRGLPRFAKVLARLLPLGLVLPAMLILSGQHPTANRELANAPPLPASRSETPPTAGSPPASEPKTSTAPPVTLPPPVSQPTPRSLPAVEAPAPPPAPATATE